MDECPSCGADEDACGCGYGSCDTCGEEWDGDQQSYEECPSTEGCSGSWVHWPEES